MQGFWTRPAGTPLEGEKPYTPWISERLTRFTATFSRDDGFRHSLVIDEWNIWRAQRLAVLVASDRGWNARLPVTVHVASRHAA